MEDGSAYLSKNGGTSSGWAPGDVATTCDDASTMSVDRVGKDDKDDETLYPSF